MLLEVLPVLGTFVALIILSQLGTGIFNIQYFIFMLAIFVLLFVGRYTLRKGFYNLTIKRVPREKGVPEGENFEITTVIENKKWLPISFLLVKEEIASEIEFPTNEYASINISKSLRVSRYSVSRYERLKRPYTVKTKKRGTYVIRYIDVTVGDVFGFFSDTQPREDIVELLVYPKLVSLRDFSFKNTSLQGEQLIKRWIHKDPLYIKGIREYNIEDRMKDIHWKSSLKMNKLMVKDYDYTSERSVVAIVNVDCGGAYWKKADYQGIDIGVELAVSIIKDSIDQGIPAGLWTNAQVASHKEHFKSEINPSLNTFRGALELGARICYFHRTSLYKYLREKSSGLSKNTSYILITPYLDEESAVLLQKLNRMGYMFHLIDISTEADIPAIKGIEKVKCSRLEGGKQDELDETS